MRILRKMGYWLSWAVLIGFFSITAYGKGGVGALVVTGVLIAAIWGIFNLE